MIEIGRNISYEPILQKWVIEASFDGENETLVFDTQAKAYREYNKLHKAGAEYFGVYEDKTL